MVHKHFRIVIVSLISVLLLASFDVHAYSGGSGSKEDPWQIGAVTDWEELMNTPAHWEMHFQITADLDFDGAVLSPVGSYDGPRFSGTLQGQGHILRNAVVRPGESTEVGLFGHLENAEVRDLGLEDFTIEAEGSYDAGGLAGDAIFSTIENCYFQGKVLSASDSTGGLIGMLHGTTLEDCYSTAEVAGFWSTGGLIGKIASGTVNRCYASGLVKAPKNGGGLIGQAQNATVLASFWNKDSSQQKGSSLGKGLSTDEMQHLRPYRNGGWQNSSWVMKEGEYPRLAWEKTDGAPIPEAEEVPLEGEGTPENPWLVKSAEDFACLSNYAACLLGWIRLENDIDLAEIKDLQPIGVLGPFAGFFDGNGHVLRNARLRAAESDYVALFTEIRSAQEMFCAIDLPTVYPVKIIAELGSPGAVRNLGVENIQVSGRDYTAGLAGNIGFDAIISGCYVTGRIQGKAHCGGITGSLYRSTISHCFTATKVVCTEDGGAFVGNCAVASIAASYTTGSVSGKRDVGGFTSSTYHAYPLGCFWEKDAVSAMESAAGKALSSEQMLELRPYRNAGWSAYPWVMEEGSHPRLAWEKTGASAIPVAETPTLEGEGTEESPWLVRTVEDFASLSDSIVFLDAHIRLGNDLDLGALDSLEALGVLGWFSGSFDGQHHVLRNATLDFPRRNTVGIFSNIVEGKVNNLGVENVLVRGATNVGALAGNIQASSISQCYVTGQVFGTDLVGGLAGQVNNGEVQASYATAAVTGEGERPSKVGGLVGYAWGEGNITNSYAHGSVRGYWDTGSLVGSAYYELVLSNSYATGAVESDSEAGGLVGSGSNCTANNCFWDMDATGQTESDLGEGLSTAEMKTMTPFTKAGWSAPWVLEEGKYPKLDWEK